MKVPALVWIAGAAVAGFALFAWRKGGIGNAAQAIGEGAVSAAGGLFTGAVTGIGEGVGVPRTDESACAVALREGRWWDASFACPAGTFVKGAWSAATEPTVDGEILDAMDARARAGTGAGTPTPTQPQSELDRLIEEGLIAWPAP